MATTTTTTTTLSAPLDHSRGRRLAGLEHGRGSWSGAGRHADERRAGDEQGPHRRNDGADEQKRTAVAHPPRGPPVAAGGAGALGGPGGLGHGGRPVHGPGGERGRAGSVPGRQPLDGGHALAAGG